MAVGNLNRGRFSHRRQKKNASADTDQGEENSTVLKSACYYHDIKVSDDVVGKNEGYYSFAGDRLIYIPIFKNSL